MSSHDYNRYRVDVEGGQLSVGVWEPVASRPAPVPSGRAVHGATSRHLFCAGVVSALPGVRVVVPVLRGRADSSTLPGPFGMSAHARVVRADVDAFADVGPVTVVGHSLVGFV